MPKTILKFKFKLPEEQVEFETACHALDWKYVVTELAEWLESQIDHGNKNEYEPVREELYGLIKDIDLSL